MKILILGAHGMLGTDLSAVFARENPILWDKENLDITKKNELNTKIVQLKPEIIINCAAYTDVDGAEKNKDLAFKINCEAVGYLAKVSQEIDAVLIHFSTEYVFDGQKKEGYNEDDKPNPINVYGESKACGEEQVINSSSLKYYLIRTSSLYGKAPQRGKPRGKNFVEVTLEKAQKGEEIKVVSDNYGKPTYTEDLARRIKWLIEKRPPYGIYHLTNERVCSWYEFAKEIIKNQYKLKANRGKYEGVKVVPAISKEYPTLAKRPKYAVLNNNKLPRLRSYKEALKDYLAKRDELSHE